MSRRGNPRVSGAKTLASVGGIDFKAAVTSLFNMGKPVEDPDSKGAVAAVSASSPAGSEYLEMILAAKVYDVCVETALTPMSRLSDRLGAQVMCKREDTQPVFSFKLRGAYNMIANLPESERAKGIITASAGNHAQGVAFSAMKLGCSAIIAMPLVTPDIKVDSVRRLGADVRLVGDNFDETSAFAQALSKEKGMRYIPPFDDPLVIAGQGTIGLELLRQAPNAELDAVFLPVGGGGLISGVGAYLKRVRPDIKIIGVEPFGACAMHDSLIAGHRVRLDKVDTFADGVAVKMVGVEPFRICQEVVDEMVLVDTDEICAAIKDIFEDTRSITEPSGALAVAGAKKWLKQQHAASSSSTDERRQLKVCAVASGANMNFERLRVVAERAGIGEAAMAAGKQGVKAEAMLATFIPEVKGSFRELVHQLLELGVSRPNDGSTTETRDGPTSITEFKYRFNPRQEGRATIFYSIETSSDGSPGGDDPVANLVHDLNEAGLDTYDLSKNDLSKDHVRYLAGGAAPGLREDLFRIEFPEKPGALRSFLDGLGDAFNISLFHYRSTGTVTGGVLVGVDLGPPSEKGREAFEKVVVGDLGWACVCETDNIAAKLFL
eukprot:CAMPEP_0171616530 /NCGR_PEP_ID=MMETSP0990-20121206/13520_1 /TAXON_ID=483369 /ORGANISM="non described non described, Strain CCMP2098" /LENGTH=605 /DNA_ID=CAMNT_0012180789 /DNA_START=28 /DNA_END=1846 /DNA_ORIENTATION=-